MHSNAISEPPQVSSLSRSFHLLSQSQHLHSSLPQILIHSIHIKAPVSFTPEPSILPTICCHLAPTWIIQPDPKFPSISRPLHHLTHLRSDGLRLQHLLLSSPPSTTGCQHHWPLPTPRAPCLASPKKHSPRGTEKSTLQVLILFSRGKTTSSLCSGHTVLHPTCNAPHSNLKPEVKYSLWGPKLPCL